MDDFKAYILSSRIANEKSADFYVHWVTGFYGYCSKDPNVRENGLYFLKLSALNVNNDEIY